jgi:hypothetical protein
VLRYNAGVQYVERQNVERQNVERQNVERQNVKRQNVEIRKTKCQTEDIKMLTSLIAYINLKKVNLCNLLRLGYDLPNT